MLVYGQDERVTAWVAKQLGYPESFPTSSAIGYERDGELVAGVCFDNASSTNVYAHIASTAEHMPPGLLVATAAFVFVQLRALRMTFLIYDNNQPCIDMVVGMGAELEARLKCGHENGDTLIYALWPTSRFISRLTSTGRIGAPRGA